MEPVRVELGGGPRPREGFINVDHRPPADILCNLERDPLPFKDASAAEVYSSHCLEHVRNLHHVLREICRICRRGGRVEIRVPAWNGDMALCPGHVHAISPTLVRHFTTDFVGDWFRGCPRRLSLVSTEYVPSRDFGEARELLPSSWSDEQIMRFVPGTCHEIRYIFKVIANG